MQFKGWWSFFGLWLLASGAKDTTIEQSGNPI